MVAPNDTSSSSAQVTSDESEDVLLAPPISTKLVDIRQDMRRRPKGYANYKILQKIGEYTVTDRDLVPARVKYLNNKEALARGLDDVSYDLNQGFDAFMEKEKDKYERRQLEENNVLLMIPRLTLEIKSISLKADERLDNFWKWIIMQAPKGSSVKEVLHNPSKRTKKAFLVLHDADIVCCRGLLKRIARTAYTPIEVWEFSAIRFDNVVFLCEQELYPSWHTESRNLLPYWYRGLKFKQHMTVNKLNEEPRTDDPVTREEHVVVFCSTLGPECGNPLKLVFNGSIDAIKAGGEMVELRTRCCAQKHHFAKDFSSYLQSFLVGIADTYVGYHNGDGLVTKVEHVPAWTLPYSQGNNAFANPCMHLLSNVLNSIRSALQNDGEACKVNYAASEIAIHPASLADVDFFQNTKFREHFGLL
ncbi:unnamed protein product [Cylicocyclus nassatus]|uniref:Decapping nuclease n=1 Tax=Cylicocyclus nassatus TaxID=53992 RepID=A0AA36GN97_CYLNA|nr:unnamed protein product [Cylicocyclus nassatus]